MPARWPQSAPRVKHLSPVNSFSHWETKPRGSASRHIDLINPEFLLLFDRTQQLIATLVCWVACVWRGD